MVNSDLLEKKIDSSGIKKAYIAQQLGISPQAFSKKRHNNIPFRASEVYVLCDLLRIYDETEKMKIFLA